MSSPFYGQTAPTESTSGVRPATYFIKCTDGTQKNIDADYLDMGNRRITFFKDMPKERDFIIASYISTEVVLLEEISNEETLR